MQSEKELSGLFARVSGEFGFVVSGELGSVAVVDRVRSTPILVNPTDRSLGGRWEAEGAAWDNPLASAGFLRGGFTPESSTVLRSISSIPACHYAFIDNTGEFKFTRYASHRHDSDPIERGEVLGRLDIVANELVQYVVDICSSVGRVYVPLSGGYDSRFVAWLVREAGIRDVLCVTYGRPDSYEVVCAGQVAADLGLPWRHFPVSLELLRSVWKSDDFAHYLTSAFNGTSLPHIGDYPWLLSLDRSGELDQSGIVLPGFCGDVLAGSFVPKHFAPLDRNQLDRLSEPVAPQLEKKVFNLSNWLSPAEAEALDAHIDRYRKPVVGAQELVSRVQSYSTEERISKFTCNAARAYEHFGLQFAFPLWNIALTSAMYASHVVDRASNSVYEEFLFERAFKTEVLKRRKPSVPPTGPVVSKIRKRVPPAVQEVAKRAFYEAQRRRTGVRTNNENAYDSFGSHLRHTERHRRTVRPPYGVNQALASALEFRWSGHGD